MGLGMFTFGENIFILKIKKTTLIKRKLHRLME
jgi:hypothetical protein